VSTRASLRCSAILGITSRADRSGLLLQHNRCPSWLLVGTWKTPPGLVPRRPVAALAP